MSPKAKLMLDFINMKGEMHVNRRACFSTNKTPEIKWLLKKGHLKQFKVSSGHGISHSVVRPTKPRNVEKIFCPCCKVDMSAHGAMWQLFVRPTSEYFSAAKHKIDCSLRIDHIYDGMRKQVRK